MKGRQTKALVKPKLADLNGLKVHLILPPSPESHLLVEHLERIGCAIVSEWPTPRHLPEDADLIILSVDPEYREAINSLIVEVHETSPPIIALAAYEDPSTLQVVLELRVAAVIERPIRPFGLLTNLMIARDIGRRRLENVARVAEAEQRHLALSKIALAKILLADQKGVSGDLAHRRLQKMAMDSRSSLDETAEKVIASLGSARLNAIYGNDH